MNCSKCDAKRAIKTGTVINESIIAGPVAIPDVTYYKCTNPECGDVVYPPGESQKTFDFIKAKEQELISSQPINQFIDAEAAYKILQITKQAFSKNKRIKRGFILNHIIGDKRLYLRESVMRFKQSGNKDGRYQICASSTTEPCVNLIEFPMNVPASNVVFRDGG